MKIAIGADERTHYPLPFPPAYPRSCGQRNP